MIKDINIRKAIIPTVGFDNRFLLTTKAQQKEMLPIVDKPIIQYIIEETIYSWTKEILIIIGICKKRIEDYLGVSFW